MFLYILFTFSVLVIFSCLFLRYSHAGRLIAKIPGPKGWPLIGNTSAILLPPDKMFYKMRQLRAEFKGPIHRLNSFNIRVINIYDPDDIETILSTTRFNEKRHPYTFLVPWLGQGLLVSNGHKWHQRRKLLTSVFHFNNLKQISRTIIEQTENLVHRLEAELGNPKTDLVPIVTKATLQILCGKTETSMGTNNPDGMSSFSSKYLKALHTFGYCLVNRCASPWLYPDSLFYLSKLWKIQKSAVKYLHNFTNHVIQERKNRVTNGKLNGNSEVNEQKSIQVLLDLLLENERVQKIDDDGIREEADTFLFANNIYEELQHIFGNDSQRQVTFEDLNEMKYLECCIKESLRIYPSVPFIARYLTEEVTLGGYRVPVGTICQINIYDIHRDEAVYPNPERFIPERFSNGSGKRHPYAYIPFSAGPRNCIGMKLAMMELKILMCGLLRRFRLEPVTRSGDVRFTGDLVLRATHPLYVCFVSRDQDSNDC